MNISWMQNMALGAVNRGKIIVTWDTTSLSGQVDHRLSTSFEYAHPTRTILMVRVFEMHTINVCRQYKELWHRCLYHFVCFNLKFSLNNTILCNNNVLSINRMTETKSCVISFEIVEHHYQPHWIVMFQWLLQIQRDSFMKRILWTINRPIFDI